MLNLDHVIELCSDFICNVGFSQRSIQNNVISLILAEYFLT